MPTEDSENDPPIIPANPVVVVQGVGHLSREFMREVGSLFWFMVQTLDETVERIRDGRVPFRASSFFRHCQRAGVGSVPLVGLVSFFLGLTMALLTGYQLQRFGTERLVPGLVAIAFTRELGPLITGIMLAARIGAAANTIAALNIIDHRFAIRHSPSVSVVFLRKRRTHERIQFCPILSDTDSLALLSDRGVYPSKSERCPPTFRSPALAVAARVPRTRHFRAVRRRVARNCARGQQARSRRGRLARCAN